MPDNYPTIQSAIDAAVSRDTIVVRHGTYVENLRILRKPLAIVSEEGPDAVFCDSASACIACRGAPS